MSENYRPLNLSVSVHPDAATRVSSSVLRVNGGDGDAFATVEIGDGIVRVSFLSYSPDALRLIGEECCRAATALAVEKDRIGREKLAETYDILSRVVFVPPDVETPAEREA